jgi:hypothetical protein
MLSWMPITSAELKTRSGYALLRSVYQEPITVADAERFIASVKKGTPWANHGQLIVGQLASVSGEVRKVLTSEKADPANPPPVATVMRSLLLRAVATLLAKASNANLQFFKDEATALEWLDGQMRTFEARRKASGSA